MRDADPVLDKRIERFGLRLKAEQLRFGLALLVLAVAIRMAIDLVAKPDELLSIDSIGA